MSQIALTMENITTFLITSSTISGKKKKINSQKTPNIYMYGICLNKYATQRLLVGV